jgi:hypothetical protein
MIGRMSAVVRSSARRSWQRARRSARSGSRVHILAGWHGLVGIAVLVMLAFVALPASTVADPTCTDTWTGDAGDGLWQTDGNWSLSAVPSSADVACIGSGVTVQITEGANQVGSVQDEGSLDISGGSLELTGSAEASNVASLTLSGGSLTGGGELVVSGSLSWSGGSMTGSGKTVVSR